MGLDVIDGDRGPQNFGDSMVNRIGQLIPADS